MSEMVRRARQQGRTRPTLSEVAELVGGTNNRRHMAILETGATFDEIEQALAWLAGADDVLGESGRQLSGRVASVYEIIKSDEPTDDEAL